MPRSGAWSRSKGCICEQGGLQRRASLKRAVLRLGDYEHFRDVAGRPFRVSRAGFCGLGGEEG